MKILVIDDEKPTLSMFKLFLTASGYEVFTAEDGEKGLEIFQFVKPDIVFTDIKMPGIDGLEVLRRIRETSNHTQVVIITGHGDMEIAIEALDLDASDFINKPVERAALNSALLRAEKRRQLKSEISFQLEEKRKENKLEIKMHGRLTQTSEKDLTAFLKNKEAFEGIEQIDLVLDDSFSINRSGVKILIEIIQTFIRSDTQVVIQNISYNYFRVFQMAGIDKMAILEESQDAE